MGEEFEQTFLSRSSTCGQQAEERCSTGHLGDTNLSHTCPLGLVSSKNKIKLGSQNSSVRRVKNKTRHKVASLSKDVEKSQLVGTFDKIVNGATSMETSTEAPLKS